MRLGSKDPRISRLRLAVVSSSASKGVRLLTQTTILGLSVRHLGVEDYGVWLTVVAALGWLSWGQAGLAPGLVNAIASSEGNGRTQDQGVYFTTALTIITGLAVLLFVFAFAAIELVSSDVARLIGISGQDGGGKWVCFLQIALVLALLRFPLALIELAYIGVQSIHVLRLCDIAAQILSAGAGMALVLANAPAGIFLLGTGITAECGVIAAGLYLVLRLRPHFLPAPDKFDFRASRSMLNLSAGYLFLQVSGYLTVNAGTLILAAYHGPSGVPAFALTMQLYQMASGVWMMFVAGLWGAIAEARARGEWSWIKRIQRQLMAGSMVLSIAFSIVLAFGGQWILRTWSGGRVNADPAFFVIMAVMCSVFTWAVLHAQILSALSYVWVQIWAAAANGVLVVGIGLLLIPGLGVAGLAAAMLLACALSTAWVYPVILAKATEMKSDVPV